MNKLYWIVCEDQQETLFEGKYLGRTRGGALKHLKHQLGRPSLSGLVFTITEIPVPLIREIVAEMLGQKEPTALVAPVVAPPTPEPPPGRYDAFSAPPAPVAEPNPFQNPQPRPEYDWAAIKACYLQGRGPKDVARIMEVPLNTLKGRINREGWAKERREGGQS